jgi:uncharacterized protein
MPIRVDGIKLALTDSHKSLRRRLAARLEVPNNRIAALQIIRKSLDARDKSRIHWVYTLQVIAADEMEILARFRDDPHVRAALDTNEPIQPPSLTRAQRPVVIGAGPAGLFAAQMLAEAGVPPIVLERGKPVERRNDDVAQLFKAGLLDPESNICFGEGGAGAYSDGKLNTRGNDPLIRYVYQTFIELGAPGNILHDAQPHLGSDKLPEYVVAFRHRLEDLGVEFRFETKVEDVVIEDGALRGLVLAGGEHLATDLVFLAIGHSASDLVGALAASGVTVEAKPFAVGVRVEHPQRFIDEQQYGRATGHPGLPPATYRLTHKGPGGRGVYSFCMCPGGVILPSGTEPDTVVVNGGSNSARSGPRANSALVVSVGPADFGEGPLDGLAFRRRLERAAAIAGPCVAPAQSVPDFLNGELGAHLPPTSYGPGVAPADLRAILPEFVSRALADALVVWDRRLRGFASGRAVLIGVETRTSSPWRIVRGEDFHAVGVRGLVPVGEGAGYAGGIASSAVDAVKAVLAQK